MNHVVERRIVNHDEIKITAVYVSKATAEMLSAGTKLPPLNQEETFVINCNRFLIYVLFLIASVFACTFIPLLSEFPINVAFVITMLCTANLVDRLVRFERS